MATLTLTLSDAHLARVRTAFGRWLGLGRDATATEVKAAVTEWMRNIVRSEETKAVVLPEDIQAS